MNLFSYGTLRSETVQFATFGRKLDGKPDVLPGYRLTPITITNKEFVTKSGAAEHRNLQFTGNAADSVEGTVFEVTLEELEQADAYEPEVYERQFVHLRSGAMAWVYLAKPRL